MNTKQINNLSIFCSDSWHTFENKYITSINKYQICVACIDLNIGQHLPNANTSTQSLTIEGLGADLASWPGHSTAMTSRGKKIMLHHLPKPFKSPTASLLTLRNTISGPDQPEIVSIWLNQREQRRVGKERGRWMRCGANQHSSQNQQLCTKALSVPTAPDLHQLHTLGQDLFGLCESTGEHD